MDKCERAIFVGLFVLNFVTVSQGALKTFRHDNDIFNRRNWLDGRLQERCDGLVFPEETYTPFLIEELNVDSLVLSHVGEVIFTENAAVELDSESDMNCVELKRLNPHFWSNPNTWNTVGKEENCAIPHKERLPCEHDDVVFPRGDRSGSIFHFGETVKMKSFTFGNDSWTNDDLRSNSAFLIDNSLFIAMDEIQNTYDITDKGCDDEAGCVCGNAAAYVDACHLVPKVDEFRCTDPVTPIGFCQPICGASIHVIPTRKFKLDEMEKNLERYASETYVSKVRNDSGYELVQIVFTEKDFSGNSLDEARELYEQMKRDFRSGHVTLLASGSYNNAGELVNNAVSIVFGTLCGVALVFVLVAFAYSPNGTAVVLRNRLNMGTGRLPSFKTAYFARRSSAAEDAGLIFVGQSLASSLLSLDKSFDNPMYGKEEKFTPSTSSPSYDQNSQDGGATSVSHHFESDVGKEKSTPEHRQFDDDADGELVDLSDM